MKLGQPGHHDQRQTVELDPGQCAIVTGEGELRLLETYRPTYTNQIR
jgi:hypothetical protein